MRKLIFINLLFITFSCSKKESEVDPVKYETVFGDWYLKEVKYYSYGEDTITFQPKYLNYLTINKGGTYFVEDNESLLPLFQDTKKTVHKVKGMGLWEFPVENTMDRIIFDKGIKDDNDLDFQQIFKYEIQGEEIKLTNHYNNYIEHFGNNYHYDYLNFATYQNTYESGVELGNYFWYWVGIYDAIKEEKVQDDPLYKGLGDGFIDAYYDFFADDIEAMPLFKEGFDAVEDDAYFEGYYDMLDRIELKKSEKPGLIFTFER